MMWITWLAYVVHMLIQSIHQNIYNFQSHDHTVHHFYNDSWTDICDQTFPWDRLKRVEILKSVFLICIH